MEREAFKAVWRRTFIALLALADLLFALFLPISGVIEGLLWRDCCGRRTGRSLSRCRQISNRKSRQDSRGPFWPKGLTSPDARGSPRDPSFSVSERSPTWSGRYRVREKFREPCNSYPWISPSWSAGARKYSISEEVVIFRNSADEMLIKCGSVSLTQTNGQGVPSCRSVWPFEGPDTRVPTLCFVWSAYSAGSLRNAAAS